MNRARRRAGAKAGSRNKPGAIRGASGGSRVRGLLAEAAALARGGKYGAAKRLCEQAMGHDPGDVDVLHFLGRLECAAGNTDIGLSLMRRALEGRPDSVAIRSSLAAETAKHGDREQALALYREILAGDPGNTRALGGLPGLLEAAGRADEALAAYETALAHQPGDAETAYNFANALHRAGRTAEAEPHYRCALAAQPDHPLVNNNLGTALSALGRHEEAAGYFRRAAALAPAFAEANYNLGIACVELGQAEEAIASFRRAIAMDPEYGPAHFRLGAELQAAGRLGEARESYSRALEHMPELAQAHYGIGALALAEDRPSDATQHLESAIGLEPDFPEAHYRLGDARADLGQVDRAIESYRRAIRIAPELTEAHVGLGGALQHQGHFEEARRCFERALELDPNQGPAYYNLALMNSLSGRSEEVGRVRAMLEDPGLEPDREISLNFTLAKVLEEQGADDEAFAAYRRANELKRCAIDYDPDEHGNYVARLMAVFGADYFQRHRGHGYIADRPVFIVGMPRSGTSLVEQIIASHPACFGGGELALIPNIIASLPGEAGFPESVAALTEEDSGRLGKTVADELGRLAPDAERVTDKLPTNFHALGLIATILPTARIVHCARDGLDTCASIYFTSFSQPLRFAYDLGALGRYHNDYRSLMDHWRSVLPLPIHEVRYERLIDDQEGASRELIGFLGLDWDSNCLAFHETQRAVQSASFWQVRQPLYASSVGRGHRFGRHLKALADILEPEGE
jgi:tetratricopeptide (TPR) repeat protein